MQQFAHTKRLNANDQPKANTYTNNYCFELFKIINTLDLNF